MVINTGKKMRHDFVNALADKGPDVKVTCSDLMIEK